MRSVCETTSMRSSPFRSGPPSTLPRLLHEYKRRKALLFRGQNCKGRRRERERKDEDADRATHRAQNAKLLSPLQSFGKAQSVQFLSKVNHTIGEQRKADFIQPRNALVIDPGEGERGKQAAKRESLDRRKRERGEISASLKKRAREQRTLLGEKKKKTNEAGFQCCDCRS